MSNLHTTRRSLKQQLRGRARLFGGWTSFGHPSITEIIARSGVDFMAIDMEHSTMGLFDAQQIIVSSQSLGVPCLPRPVSHGIEMIKPMLDSGADGLIAPMVSTPEELRRLVNLLKFPPAGRRSFGVARAHGYGFYFDAYVSGWNESSPFIIQIETVEGVENIDQLLQFEEVDGVMIGPYDLSGSLGVPGQPDHLLVREAAHTVVEACARYKKSCGTQIAAVDRQKIDEAFAAGYTFIILSSDLFVLWQWSAVMKELIKEHR
ncbi:4-hydroxy-2-oxovalerate aldolase [Candidatus Uhrbacteria bacterium]|nr:4-hydroxy-2-oxovalerate aldolase [Candidatus Uhrbacteria bacterium]